MTQYNALHVILSNSQLKLKSAIKNETKVRNFKSFIKYCW